ncbi:MAG: four helix bundle protein [Candidatus Ratteibacteria bacterium]|nr:four helix bundle protein [Candidatus Ratteibacteria bacterium]
MTRNQVKNYKDLLIWRKGIDLVKKVYNLTKALPRTEELVLINQMRRAAISIPSNIAEGQARQHSKEFKQFLYVALGSLAELHTQIVIAEKLGYIDNAKEVDLAIVELQKMIGSLLTKIETNY